MLDKYFFAKHQKSILRLANTNIGRGILCIDKNLPKIQAILPHALFWEEKGKYHFDIRTHEKYGKRIFYGFYPLWKTCHFLDMNLINKVQPKWNLGFDNFPSQPYYPDAGTGGATIDGWVSRQNAINENFATIRAGAGDMVESSDTEQTIRLLATTTNDQYESLKRFASTFDARIIPDDATIDSVVYSVYGSSKNDGLGTPEIDVVAYTGAAATLAASDYANFGTTVFASKTYADYSTIGYNDFTLDASGIANLSKSEISKYGLRLNWDTDNSFGGTWSSGLNSLFQFFAADETGTSKDPKITGTYTPVATVGGNMQNIFNYYY